MDFEPKVSPEQMAEIRRRCLEMSNLSHEERANRLASDFTDLSQKTLKDYSAMVLGCTEKVWSLFVAGKIKPSIVREIYSMDSSDQDQLVEECVAKDLPRSVVKKVRHYKKDLRTPLPEAITRAVREAEENRSYSIEKMLESRRKPGEKKTNPSDQKLSREVGSEMRKKFRMAIGKTHEERARMFQKDYPWLSVRTMEGYSRVCNNCSEKVWNFLLDGKISLTTCEEMTDWETADQDKIIDECQARGIKLSVYQMRAFKKGGTLAGIEQVFTVPDATPVPASVATPSSPIPKEPAEEPSPEEAGDSDEELLPGESKVTREQILELRRIFREMPEEMSNDARAEAVMKDYPGVSRSTLEKYCGICLQCTEKVWNLYIEGKVNIGILFQIYALEKGDQNFFIDEIVEKKLKPSVVRKARRFRKENHWGWPECIAKASGKVPANEPRKATGHQKSFDSLLDEIAAKGARWRAMVVQAVEMAEQLEMKSGFHEALFAKVYVLRELISNQYDLVNSRLQRYMNIIKKNYQKKDEEKGELVDVQDVKVIDIPKEEVNGQPENSEFAPIPDGERRPAQDGATGDQGVENTGHQGVENT